jgi:hypothetical protein
VIAFAFPSLFLHFCLVSSTYCLRQQKPEVMYIKLATVHLICVFMFQDWFTVTDRDGKCKERYLFLFKARILICKVRRISDDRSVFVLKDIIRVSGFVMTYDILFTFSLLKPKIISFPEYLQHISFVQMMCRRYVVV